jgi:hypothetical protein
MFDSVFNCMIVVVIIIVDIFFCFCFLLSNWSKKARRRKKIFLLWCVVSASGAHMLSFIARKRKKAQVAGLLDEKR